MPPRAPIDVITDEARRLGFPLVGATPLAPLSRGDYLAGWLADGRAGDMGYLTTRTAERLDPRRAHPWARSILCVAYPYRPPAPPPVDWRRTLRGRVAAYAAGADYHDRVRGLLRTLAQKLRARLSGTFRAYVDTGPVLEREWASRAGLGWIGKNTLLLQRVAGSYFFLGELFTDLRVDPVPLPADHCGTCTRCLTACPTGALGAYTMDPRRCISYLTIEHRGPIPPALRPALENWIFGCDLCQEVCPWNRDARDDEAAELLAPALPPLLALDDAGFRARFGRTAVTRTRRRGLLRNVAIALGNSGNPDAVPSLTGALADAEALVRGHAAWALARLGGRQARAALEQARHRETDAGAGDEIDAALAETV